MLVEQAEALTRVEQQLRKRQLPCLGFEYYVEIIKGISLNPQLKDVIEDKCSVPTRVLIFSTMLRHQPNVAQY